LSIKQAIRTLLTGRSSRYFDDELVQFNLKDVVPIADASDSSRRLNVVLPSLSASRAFGGLATQVSLPIQMFSHGLAQMGWKLRFISLDSVSDTDNLAKLQIHKYGLNPAIVSFHYINDNDTIRVSENDIFLGSLWFCHIWSLPLLEFQLHKFGGPKRPYISLVQDYEPNFHPWSSAYIMARGAYDSDWPKRVIFNSSELAQYYKMQGHQYERSAIFEPVLHHSLREKLNSEGRKKKERRILFYGRPDDRRNCFYLGRRALELWSERYHDSFKWNVISVGADYPAFALANGKRVDVIGKLPINLYIDQLERAAVGLSLMASPHPSYPPLEMAHFGALTISNSFDCKDVTTWHKNLFACNPMTSERLSELLVECCEAFESKTEASPDNLVLKPQYLCDFPEEKILELIDLISG